MKKEKRKRVAYWQPEFDNDGRVTGHTRVIVFSFQVWKSKKNLLRDFPRCNPLSYEHRAIESPTFMD